MSAKVFISFASKDQKVANTICTALERRGFSCWISSRDIAPGDNFQSAIVSAIKDAKVMLLVFTANSNSSNEMTKELAIASQQNLIVVPLRVEDVAPNAAFAYEFATRQWIDLFVDWEKAIDQLCERLTRAMPPEEQPIAPGLGRTSTAAPARKSSAGLFVGIAVAVLVVAGLLFALPMLTAKKTTAQATPPPATPVPATTPAAPAAPAQLQAASAPASPSGQTAPRATHELAVAGAHARENTHSDAYICAHGDDADYRTTQACDRKDRNANDDSAN